MPSSLAVGFGCAAQSNAPVVHIDLLSPGGLALCASWAREPMCKWVHIRVPTSAFPILHSSHVSEPHQEQTNYLHFLRQLVKHCDDTDTPWSVECRARSCFWNLDWPKELAQVQINLCQFGHDHRCPVLLAFSRASAFASISGKCNHKHASVHKPAAINAQVSSAFYAALGDSILRSLGFSPAPCTLSPLHQAQISLGLQPRKIALSLVPEFKHRLVVSLCEQPPLINGKLVHDLCLPHVLIPAGSKLLVGPEKGGMGHGPPGAGYPSQPYSSSSVPRTNCSEHHAPLCGSDTSLPSSLTQLDHVSPKATSVVVEATPTRGNPNPSILTMATSSGAVRLSNDPPLKPKATSSEAGLPDSPPLILTPKKRARPAETFSPAQSDKNVCNRASVVSDPFSPEATSGAVEATLTRGHPSPSILLRDTSPEVGRSSNDPPLKPRAPSSEAGLHDSPPLILTPKKRARPTETCSPAKSDKNVCNRASVVSFPFHHEAEYEACVLQSDVSREDLLRIFDLLPGESTARTRGSVNGKAWSSGAYAKGGCVGLRRNAKDFPCVTRLLVAYLRARLPSARLSCVSVFSDLKQGMHRDSHNMADTLNYVTALSTFDNGQLWIECEEGTKSMSTPAGKRRGRLAEVAKEDLAFDAKRYHCVMSWEGRRVVLVGFTPQCGKKLETADRDALLSLGFPLPWVPLCDLRPNPVNNTSPSLSNRVLQSAPTEPQPSVPVEPVAAGLASQTRFTFGVYHSEAEFVSKAIEAGHPRDLYGQLPLEMQNCVDSLSLMPESSVIAKRAAWFTKWTKRAREIQREPDPEWVIVDPAMAKILDQKRLQLLDEIISEEGYDDISLARDIRDGFDLVGVVPTSGILPGKVVPASLHPNDLRASAPRANEALKTCLGSCGDAQLDKELWEKTMKEVDAGWLVGPLEWDQLDPSDVTSHRFPLQQGAKVRPIDDYSRSGVNAAVTTLEQPTVDTSDVAAAMYSRLANKLMMAGRPALILGRSYDLTSAYRQLCVSKRSSNFANIAVFCPGENRTFVFKQLCLPFGSRASVNGFIRCSRCIQWVALRCLVLPLTSYYDDFLAASNVALAKNTENSMSMLFQLLGWKYDTEGPKADVFSDSVSALGVRFDLSRTHEGVVVVDNTCKRKEDLDKMVADILEQGSLDHRLALELRGKLAFADAQVMGLAGRFALQQITAHAYHSPFKARLSYGCSTALKFLRKRIAEGTPRAITPAIKDCWLLFTDASFHEDGSGGLGGVLVSPSGSLRSWFSLPLGASEIAPLLPLHSVNAIGELETIAVALALQLWCNNLASCCLVSYIDNEGAKFSLVKGCSRSPVLARICHWVATLCEKRTILPWFSRVPSPSNIADAPSKPHSAQAAQKHAGEGG